MKSKTIYQFWTWKIFAHFKTIKDEPSKFFLWFLTSIILSLSSFWIPIVIGFLIKEDFYRLLMMNNPFIVFSIVFLSNTILYSINHIGGGSNKFAVNIRGITLVTLIMYLILLSTIIPLKLLKNISLEHEVQFILLTITIMLGIYAYGFRESTWEKSVDEANKEQNETVAEMAMKANNTNNEEGFKL